VALWSPLALRQWPERFLAIEVVDEPSFTYSNFVHGYDMLPVRIPG
jgi:hypothetical protein